MIITETHLSVANGKDPASISGLTKDQARAYKGLMEFINSPYNENDYKRAVIGAAGVGKTYLLKAIIKNCDYTYSQIFRIHNNTDRKDNRNMQTNNESKQNQKKR
mgnify:CR=1 FL=1